MPILGYDKFLRSCKYMKLEVPEQIWERLEEIKGNDEAVQAYGVEFAV